MSQFTLLASTKKGNKPDFHGAMGGDEAKKLYQYFFQKVQQGYQAEKVKDGVFQAMMQVALVNDGPVSPVFLRRVETCINAKTIFLGDAGSDSQPAAASPDSIRERRSLILRAEFVYGCSFQRHRPSIEVELMIDFELGGSMRVS